MESATTVSEARPVTTRLSAYERAGVNEELADVALRAVIAQLRRTNRRPELEYGYFATVIEFAGTGLAMSMDGVGSKVLIAQMMDKYDTIGIDCVAMNVNDLICVGATPISMLDYISVQVPDPGMLEAIAEGLRVGANQANISIPGGEIAQLRDTIRGHGKYNGFDLVGNAMGSVGLDKIIIGADIKDGDVVVGLRSNGVHCNGLTLARDALLGSGAFSAHDTVPGLNRSVGEELLAPTHIYVPEALEVLDKVPSVKALIHMTSYGFNNLSRVENKKVAYVIDSLPPTPTIFSLIQKHGQVTDEEMFKVFNMGIGFCFVVAPGDARKVISIAESHHRKAQVIGKVDVSREPGSVTIETGDATLIGKDKVFRKLL